jgi:hypothetical protein
VKHLLPLLADVVVGLIVLSGLLLRKAWDIQSECKFWEVSTLVLLWHHALLVDILVGNVQYLENIRGNAGVAGAVANE